MNKISIFLLSIIFTVADSGCNEGVKISTEGVDNSLIYFKDARLQFVKEKIAAGDSYFVQAYNTLLVKADELLDMEANPVINKTIIPPSGDKHDYMSIAPYFWPDPSKPDGMPWIARDGEVNPQTRGDDTDQVRMKNLLNAVELLTFAYCYSGDKKYSSKAKDLIRVWFIAADTKVNPSMNYGQSIPGGVDGRHIGIIEWTGIPNLVTAIQIFDRDGLLDGNFKDAVNDWLQQYLDWLTTSEIAKREDDMKQNHGSWFDFQAIGLLRYFNRNDEARQRAETAKTKRIASQIEPDGSLPLELRRTKSIYYSEMNLRALALGAELSEPLGVDLLNFETPDGRSIKKAVAFLKPYALHEKQWEYKQITPGGVEAAIEHRLKPMFSIIQTIYGEKLIDEKANVEETLDYLQKLQFPPIQE